MERAEWAHSGAACMRASEVAGERGGWRLFVCSGAVRSVDGPGAVRDDGDG